MKTIGLIGGSGWLSTVEYYSQINRLVNERLRGFQFAQILLYSLNFADIYSFIQNNQWKELYKLLLAKAKMLESNHVDCILLCANTLHIFADELSENLSIPVIHIGVETAKELKNKHITTVGLLGTKTTMEGNFYRKKLEENGLITLIPNVEERNYIQQIIETELLKGIFDDSSRNEFVKIMQSLKLQGAEAIILGCTEIPLLVQQQHFDLPLFDTLSIHAKAAVDFVVS